MTNSNQFEAGDVLRRAWRADEDSDGPTRIRLSGDLLNIRRKLTDLALPGTSLDTTARVSDASEAARLEVELARTDFTHVIPEDFIDE